MNNDINLDLQGDSNLDNSKYQNQFKFYKP